jgi:hypothetical protein
MADEVVAPAAPVPASNTDALEARIAELTAKVQAVLEAKATEAAAAPVVTEVAKPWAIVRAWTATWNFAKALKGIRTLLFFTVTGGLGLLDAFNGIDLTGLAQRYLGANVKVGDIMTFLSIAGILLRFVSNTPIFARWRAAATGTGVGPVDEPVPLS